MIPITPELLRAEALPDHEGAGSKEGRGRVLVVAGCREVPGAALLAAVGALRAGAGKLQIGTCAGVAPHLGLAVPEAMVLGLEETAEGGIAAAAAGRVTEAARKVAGLVVGPGMVNGEDTAALVTAVLEGVEGVPMVLDAAALGGLAAGLVRRQGGRVVLTPHTGEMARLLGVPRTEVEADKLACARRVASEFQCVVVMKGACTEIVSPDGGAWLFDGGTVGLATSGSGDTLAGVIGGMLARGAPALRAAMWGVYVHGEAGARLVRRDGGIGFLARELLDAVPGVMASV